MSLRAYFAIAKHPERKQSPLHIVLFLLASLLLFSCSTGTPSATPQLVTVYSTSAAQPWLAPLYACAESSAVISRVDDDAAADIILRIGEPDFLASPAYQIGEEKIIVVMNPARPPVLDFQQIRGVFTGVIPNWNQITPEWGSVHSDQDGEVHVWTFSADEDIQQAFNKIVLDGRPVVSSSSLAATPQQMINAIQKDESAIGILAQSWNANNEVFEQEVVATVPVLAITNSEPQGVIQELIACLQK